MSKSQYDYAPDEFDAPAPQGAPAGVHRTQRSGWSKTWPFLAVIVVFAGIAYGGFVYISNRTTESPTAAGTTASTPAASATMPSQSATSKAPTQTSPSTPAPSTTDAVTGTVNKGALVRVLNGAHVDQLAAVGAQSLKNVGYTNVQADTYTGQPLPKSVVYYATQSDEATAVDVGKQFGLSGEQIQLAGPLKGGASVSVILMTDYR